MAPDLLEAIYAAPLEPDRWTDAIQRVSRLVGADGAHLAIWDGTGSQLTFLRRFGMGSPECERLFAQHYGKIDPRRQRAMTLPIGEWLVCQQVCDDRFVASSEFYQDFLIPKVGCRYVAGVRLAAEDGLHAMLSLSRRDEPGAAPFSEESLAPLREVTAHLSRAAHLQLRLSRLEAHLGIRGATLDQLSMAVALVDRDAAVRYANLRGAAVLEGPGSPFETRGGRLVCRSAREVGRFATTVAAAVDRRVGDALRLETGNGAALHCVVVPLSPRAAPLESYQRPMVLLVFIDPAARPSVDRKALQSLFGLTRAEARVAAGLAAGQSLGTFAQESGISIMTARAQLRAVFAKVGVNRQTELVAILQRLTQVDDMNVPGA